MNMFVKKTAQNIAILFLALIGLSNLFLALPLRYINRYSNLYSRLKYIDVVSVHQVLSFVLGVLMLMLAYSVYKRIRNAWIIEMIMLTATIILQSIHHHSLELPIILIELFVWLVLSLSYKDFSRKADKITVIRALGFILVSVILVIVNATIGMFLMKSHITNIHDIYDALEDSIKLLVFMDTSVLLISSKIGRIYADSLITINWFCIITSLFLILKPLVYNPIESKYDKAKVRGLVMNYGQNPLSYLSLENDKKYLFGKHVNGVCSYQVVGNVFVVCGDMICNKADGFVFLNEIIAFCNQNGYELLFLNTTDFFIELYKMAGFGILKNGEDACFKLSEYNLAGGKVAKVRAAINHADKLGVKVLEYKPLETRNYSVEHQISDITKEWKKTKGGYDMKFMLGETGLEDPLDRRYFYALNGDDNVLGFAVFLPYLSGKGYLADITRRRVDSPQGVMEKIIFEAFMKMQSEGVIWGNMGLSPLYNVGEDDRASIPEKLFKYIYENMNKSYDFKSLHHSKKKYAPTEWQTRYIAYSPRPFSPNFAYAMLRVQVGKGLSKIVFGELGKKGKNEEN